MVLGLVVKAKTLLYIDSERCKRDFHDSWTRFLQRAGIGAGDIIPASVQWQNIKALENLEARLQYLWSRIDSENAPEIVFIDGIGDFVNNVNDPDECVPLVYRLSAIADVRNIGIITTLHTNPRDVKARGVLGSELWRKAECVLIIDKKTGDDVRCLTTDFSLGKNRGGSDQIASYFRWAADQKMHVSCAAPAEAKGKTVVERDIILKMVGTRPAWSYSELWKAIAEKIGKSSRTAKERITLLVDLGKITRSDAGTYSLADEKRSESPDYIHD